jgi:RNA polymerase sigma-70 factor, ECF subfamily
MDTAQTFITLKPRLFGIAYRMLGTRSDAEDVVQGTWLRWHETDHAAIRSAEAWLVTVTTRLSIDRLRARTSKKVISAGGCRNR